MTESKCPICGKTTYSAYTEGDNECEECKSKPKCKYEDEEECSSLDSNGDCLFSEFFEGTCPCNANEVKDE